MKITSSSSIINMENKCTVSIILPVFNCRKYIAKSICSILSQSYRNFEFIIIDDGSNDGTSEIIDFYSSRDDRIKLIRRENKGLVYSLNEGIDYSIGKYIARMDADDISEPTRIEQQIIFLEKNPDVVLLGVRTFSSNWFKWRYIGITGKKVCTWSLVFRNRIGHPGVMFRSDIVRDKRLRYREDYIYAEDFRLWVEMTQYGYADILPQRLLFYRQHDESISNQKFIEQQIVDRKIVTENIKNRLGIDMNDCFNMPPVLWAKELCLRVRYSSVYNSLDSADKRYFHQAFQDYLAIFGAVIMVFYIKVFGVRQLVAGGFLAISFIYRSLKRSIFPCAEGFYTNPNKNIKWS